MTYIPAKLLFIYGSRLHPRIFSQSKSQCHNEGVTKAVPNNTQLFRQY